MNRVGLKPAAIIRDLQDQLFFGKGVGRPLACGQLRSVTKQGYPLEEVLEQSVKAGCGWLLVFRQDLQRPDFRKQVSNFYSHRAK